MSAKSLPLEHDATHRASDVAAFAPSQGTFDEGDRAAALARSLERAHMSCMVEARAGLALIVCDEAQQVRLASVDARRDVLALARQHGFTHIAVELASHPTT